MLIFFYKKYPNSPLATFVSLLSSLFLLVGALGVYFVIHGLVNDASRDDITAGTIMIAIGVGLLFLFRFLARRISERKAAKQASKNAAKNPLFTELHREDRPGFAQPSSDSPVIHAEPKPARKKAKRGSVIRKIFGTLLVLAPALAFIGRIENGTSPSMGIIQSLAYYGALIAMFFGGLKLLEKSSK